MRTTRLRKKAKPSVSRDEVVVDEEPYVPRTLQVQKSPMETTNSNSGSGSVSVSVILSNPSVLNCSICLHPLTIPAYQCKNGHIACSSCCTKVDNKCPSCRAEIGNNRCRAIEKVVESVRVSCCYFNYGCKETVIYCKKREHEEMCIYTPCPCPIPDCIFRGSHKRLSHHMSREHPDLVKRFRYYSTFPVVVGINERFVVLQEEREGTLFILSHGNTVEIRYIDPSLSEVTYELFVREGDNSLKFLSRTRHTTGQVSDPPSNSYFLIPGYFYDPDGCLKFDIRICGRD